MFVSPHSSPNTLVNKSQPFHFCGIEQISAVKHDRVTQGFPRLAPDRVRATGYAETLVGENIAYGPKSVPEVVRGWLDSPDHCENIMDPRFREMGIALAQGSGRKHGLYWVQVLAAPKA